MGLQERRVPHLATYNSGIGIDSLSGMAMNQAVEPVAVPPLEAGGARQMFRVSRVSSTHDLQQSLGIDASASLGCASFGAGVSARFSFAESSNVHSASLFMTITATVNLADLSIAHCKLTAEAAAVAGNPETFRNRYGDMFARACRRGGIFVGLMKVETFDESKATKIESELRGSYGFFSAEASANFKTVTENHNAQVYCQVYAEGGPPIQIKDPTDPRELLEAANAWLKAMYDDPNHNAMPYDWTMSPISIAEGPVLNTVDIEHGQDVLKFCAGERATLLDQLNLLSWWSKHPDRYEWSGDTTVEHVVTALQATQNDLDLIADCASAAINDPKQAQYPSEFAKSRDKVYPAGHLPAAAPKALGVVTPPVDLSDLAAFTPDAVLLTGGWLDATRLQDMSPDNKRNALITVMSARTRIPEPYFYQRYKTEDLAAKGAMIVFLMKAGIRSEPVLRTMTVDDQRNTLIVENAAHTAFSVGQLQGMSDRELVQVGLSWFPK